MGWDSESVVTLTGMHVLIVMVIYGIVCCDPLVKTVFLHKVMRGTLLLLLLRMWVSGMELVYRSELRVFVPVWVKLLMCVMV